MSEKEYNATLIEYEWPNGSKSNGYTHELTISSSSLMKLVETQG